jgi:hypothetical protein
VSRARSWLAGLPILWMVVALSFAGAAEAQSKSMCLTFFDSTAKLHTRVECVEALFSDPKLHFTFSSLPPGNGFALGGMFEDEADHVSSQGKLSSAGVKLAIVGSENQSWLANGSFDFTPALYRPDHDGADDVCQRMGALCTKTQLSLHLQAVHRSLQTISFYGLGSRSPAIKHTFHENDTYGIVSANLPLTNHIAVEGGLELLQPQLPASTDALSVSQNFTDATAPGLTVQPTFVHSHVGILTTAGALSNPRTDDSPLNHAGPLMKRNIRFTFNNGAEYAWYTAANDPGSSFQRLVVTGDESVALGSNVRRYVTVADEGSGLARKLFYGVLHNACGDGHEKMTGPDSYVIKVTQQCNYGKLDLRTRLMTSRSGSGSTVPFYLQPTVGGADIDSNVSLRGFPDYRFRDRHAVVEQAEYSVPITDPVGLLLFYDAGTVGPAFSDLSFAHLRQDGGLGVTFRLQGNVVAQAYMAWGAGHGPLLNYSFSKLF